MTFYQQLSKYYDSIFQTSEVTVDFISEITGKAPNHILDVACGTGGYSLELAKRGYKLCSTDLDVGMVDALKVKALEEGVSLEAYQGNMLEILSIPKSNFQTILCIGNSLVHLSSITEMKKFLSDAYRLLSEGGNLVIQTVNFDKIFIKNQTELPLIHNSEKDVSFERNYKLLSEERVTFKTKLTVGADSFENAIYLTPLFSDVARDIFEEVGFKEINIYGGFQKAEYVPSESNALVIVARK